MSRASGRHKPRTGGIADPSLQDSYDPGPGSGEGNAIGESELTDPAGSPIPGGQNHIVNYETVRHPVPVPDPPPLFDGMMAHGVPVEPRTEAMQRAAERGTGRKPPRVAPQQPAPAPPAVPVYVVEQAGKPRVLRSANPVKVTIPNNASDPYLLCGTNPNRVRIGLLNEDGTTDVRFGRTAAETTNGAGALLPHAQSSYLWLHTQDEIHAVTTSSTLSVVVSVIEEYEANL